MTNPNKTKNGHRPVTIILIDDRWLPSLVRDAGTFLLAVALIGIGKYLNSNAMEWLGFVMFFMAILAQAGSGMNKSKYTLDEARKKIDELSAERFNDQ